MWAFILKVLMTLVPLFFNDGTVADPQTTTIVGFTANWCHQCQLDKPRLAELRKLGYNVVMYDVDERPDMVKKYKVKIIPAYFVNGEQVDIHRRE